VSIRTDIEIYSGDLSEFSDIEIGKALAQGVNLSYQALPDSLMQEQSFPPVQLNVDNVAVDFSSKTVLHVKRYDGNGKERICIEVSPLKWDDYSDNSSIYCATKHNPVYAVKNVNNIPVLMVAPDLTGAANSAIDTAFAYWRPTYLNLESQLDNVLLDNFPQEANTYAIYSAAILILGFKLKNAALEEEDTELAQLIQMQMQSVKGQLDAERNRLNKEEKGGLNEESIEQIADPTQGKPTQR
tara:strand:+ start:3071 stop:3796 length:726 start_codon:yes stop_codon:yes gene_type:complete